MHLPSPLLSGLALVGAVTARHHTAHHSLLFNQLPLQEPDTASTSSDALPLSTRAHWMRIASSANLAISACPFAPYGTAVVNHTLSFSNSTHLGELVCTGVNDNHQSGNPTLHGEMAAFGNCSKILTDPKGVYRFSAAEAQDAWKSFSLYTTAEPCPMCAGAIAWAELKEVVYGTSIQRLIELGWPQIEIGSQEVFERAWRLGGKTKVVHNVLGEEMDRWFGWQFRDGECPEGCTRTDSGCIPVG